MKNLIFTLDLVCLLLGCVCAAVAPVFIILTIYTILT